jgi:hypothetical protein
MGQGFTEQASLKSHQAGVGGDAETKEAISQTIMGAYHL